MGGYGRQNPFPFQYGGGTSVFEGVWLALRAALGEGGAGPIGSIEDAWRESKAVGITAAESAFERAVVQAFPFLATDHLPLYRQLLRLGPGADEQSLRVDASAAWSLALEAMIPSLRESLQEIDAGLDVVTISREVGTTTGFGLWIDGVDFHPTLQSSQFPNYSTHFVLHVLWTGLAGGIPDAAKRLRVECFLNEVLPAWVDWTIFNGQGFFLDGFSNSFLDLTAFGS